MIRNRLGFSLIEVLITVSVAAMLTLATGALLAQVAKNQASVMAMAAG